MSTTATDAESTARPLFLAIELSQSTWKLGFALALAQRPREIDIPARNVDSLLKAIQKAKKHFKVPLEAPLLSCFEAGRDGFWLHRYLLDQGVKNVVIDPASVAVQRKARRAKTDRLDVAKLLKHLIRSQDDPKEWSVVQVPTAEQEDARQLHRELEILKKERTQHINRIKSHLVCQGLRLAIQKDFLELLERSRLWDGSPLPAGIKERIVRELERLRMVDEQIKLLKKQRREALKESSAKAVEIARKVQKLRGLGEVGSWNLSMEVFSWREIKNRRQLGRLSGLTPTPFQSGNLRREQGIEKAGLRWIRPLAVELAWGWLRFQPESEITCWYNERFGRGSKRSRKIGIVAVARKLLIALWRFVTQDIVPKGAVLKAA